MVESKPFTLPFQLGSTLKVKEFAHFFKSWTPIVRVKLSRKANRKTGHCLLLKNGGEIMGGVPNNLLGFRPINTNKTISVNTAHQQSLILLSSISL